MTGPRGGYRVDPGGLDGLVRELHSGADAFNGLANQAPVTPDCGASTELVGKALAKLVGSSAGLGGVLVQTADKIHRSNGSYGTVENVAANRLDKGMHGPQ
ncbi:hypothetical protein [Amycolatopsis saalfeldensis]|uniref:Excreted virulence factor EspC, type VII ESX diderm n=1 Tax=Amycolatopsis saalfeldensis TaxID=394193 RepID=A0A1H8TFI3_9PSEU|nr:hypothetical protein [Amycolatopsis saalfeldensis]SEO89631.1 hypothetical protein SAMN04489732_102591 [Amycolatopsis saalfeldensis]